MKKILVSFLLLHSVIAFAGGRGDDPMLTMAKINQIEWRETDQGDAAVVEADAWLGKDLNKFWLKVDVERMKGNTDDLELLVFIQPSHCSVLGSANRLAS